MTKIIPVNFGVMIDIMMFIDGIAMIMIGEWTIDTEIINTTKFRIQGTIDPIRTTLPALPTTIPTIDESTIINDTTSVVIIVMSHTNNITMITTLEAEK
jgi:hypothetical protein